MGLLDFFRKRKTPVTEVYSEVRKSEREWFEKHYDLSTLESIANIPERSDLPKPPGNSPTGEVYYFLRYKARQFEMSGNIKTALICMRKSIVLMQLKFGATYGREECYTYVRMLARNGFEEEARKAKLHFENYYDTGIDTEKLNQFHRVCKQAADLRTDLLIMSVQGSVCSECARYQGRVYSISGQSNMFPRLPATIAKTGVVHKGCTHQFFPYIHGSTNPKMDYTLMVHPLKDKSFGRNIIAFSNRPFVDDRTEECKKAAEAARERRKVAKLNKQRYNEIMIEREVEKQNDYQDFEWLRTHFPDKCPSTPSGYRRMKTQNTKNYQLLKQLAANVGREI